jgi:enoyl-CoA hydratase/carnithine racemase
MVIAASHATFGLPESKRGLYAAAGGLPRVVRTFGMQLASELALAGRILKAEELQHLGFLRISKSPDSLLDEAVQLGKDIASSSPDAVIVSRAGLREAWETASVERSAQVIEERFAQRIFSGENFKIGVEAFATKKQPIWVPSKL